VLGVWGVFVVFEGTDVFFFFLFFLFCDQDPNKNLASLDNIMQMVDPYNNQHITFSEAVGALSAELVTMMTRKRMDNR
jgi:hypothetical protein